MSYTDDVERLLGAPALSITSVRNEPMAGRVLNLEICYTYRGQEGIYHYPLAQWEEYADDSPEGMAGGLANLVKIELLEMLEVGLPTNLTPTCRGHRKLVAGPRRCE